MKTTTTRAFSAGLLTCFVLSLTVATAGCFSKGKKGYICKSSKECHGKLRCKTFRAKGKTRKACVSSGTTRLSSNETYTKWAVYGTWGFTILLGIGVVAFVIQVIRVRRRTAGQPPAGQPPVGQPPVGQPPVGQPPTTG